MKLKNRFLFAGVLMIISSCGESSTKNETQGTLSTGSESGIEANHTSVAKKSVEAPPATRTSFETKYPGATEVNWTYYDQPYTSIDWELAGWPTVDQNDYMVTYDWNGSNYYSWYDQDGNWIGTTTVITDFNNGLPSAVNNTLQNQFNGYTVVAVDKENDKNREAYEIDLEKGADKLTALIASDGTVIKKKGKVGGEKVKEKIDVK